MVNIYIGRPYYIPHLMVAVGIEPRTLGLRGEAPLHYTKNADYYRIENNTCNYTYTCITLPQT